MRLKAVAISTLADRARRVYNQTLGALRSARAGRRETDPAAWPAQRYQGRHFDKFPAPVGRDFHVSRPASAYLTGRYASRRLIFSLARFLLLRSLSTNVATRINRAATLISADAYVEEEEKAPDRLAEDAVVCMVNVPLTAAVVPDAVTVPLKEAVPEPPATASSSASVSSRMISM